MGYTFWEFKLRPECSIILSMPPQNNVPLMPLPTQVMPPPKRSHTLLIIVVLVIVLIIGVATTLAFTGFISIPFLTGKAPYDKDHFLTGVVGGIKKINTAAFSANLHAYTKAREADVQGFDDKEFGGMSANIPSFDVTLGLDGATQETNNILNSKAGISAAASFGDFTASVQAEVRKISDNFYFEITKMPSFFGIDPIKNKWVKITPQDIAQYGSEYGYRNYASSASTTQAEIDKTKKQAIEVLKMALEVADKDQAVKVKGNPVKESVGKVAAYRYDLEFDKTNVVKFYQDFVASYNQKFATSTKLEVDQSAIAYLNSKESDKAFEYLKNNVQFSIWADADGIPLKYLAQARIAFDSAGKKGTTQINSDFTLTLVDINKPVSVDAPSSAINWDDAYMLMTGKTKDEVIFDKQTQAVSVLWFALANFQYDNKKYPASLDELTTQQDTSTSSLPGSRKILAANVPNDVYTGKSFVYSASADGKSYTLKYTINLPEYKQGVKLYTLKGYNYVKNKSVVYLKYVNGVNTATPNTTSSEALATSKIDSDGDGISDSLEKYVGTNPNKKDTDGNGTSDYDEIMKL